MSLRSRLTLAASVAVAVAVAAAAGATYLIVRGELRGEIDSSLRERAASAVAVVPARAPRILTIPRLPPPAFGGAPGYVQLVTARGIVVRAPLAGPRLPAEARARAVASGQSGAFFTDTRVQGIHVRVLTTRLGPRTALQVARPLTEVDRTLRRLRRILLVIVAGGIALAAALGTGVARAALAPLRRLSETAGQVTRTRDLSRRVEATGRDELGRLAASFNTMLGALDESMRAQRQLVADASHELRTPLTSLRTNVEVLTRQERLSQEEYRRLLGDIVAQTEELASLVADVVELARESRPEVEAEDVRLDLLVEHAVERARRNSPHVRFELEGEPTVVRGVTSRLERAVGNLLDNAAKWSPTGSPIEVSVRGGEVVVRDHGPGISEADLPHVFDRFYRAPDARRLPGSGLGLAIVRQVAELHGGVASAEQAEGGGARFRLKLA